MQYALNIILNTLLTFIASMIIGWSLHNTINTLLFYTAFSLLRVASGGKHLKTAAACNLVTILCCSFIPYLLHLHGILFWAANVLSFIIMLIYAPNPDKNAQIPLKCYPALKLFSIALVGSNFFISSSVLGLAYLLQSLTVITWKRRGSL